MNKQVNNLPAIDDDSLKTYIDEEMGRAFGGSFFWLLEEEQDAVMAVCRVVGDIRHGVRKWQADK